MRQSPSAGRWATGGESATTGGMTKTWTWCALALAGIGCGLSACGPNKAPPVQMVIDVQTTSGKYEPKAVTFNTLTDVVAMKGRVAELIGGARIVISDSDPQRQNDTGPLTDEQLANILLKNKGLPVSASYVEKDGVLWPADFHTWNMASAYYNFEKAFEFFQGLGIPQDEMTTATVYYFPEYIDGSNGTSPVVTNALFYSPVQAFLLLPYDPVVAQQEGVPLAMNFGIVAHEYSHRIFNKRVYDGQGLPAPLSNWDGAPANILKAVDEGLADWNGWGATCTSLFGCNTRFLEASLGSAAADARDMQRNDKCLTSGLVAQVSSYTTPQFTQAGLHYQLGTILASSLWHAAQTTEQLGVIQRAVLASYNDPTLTEGFEQRIQENINTPENFTLPVVLRSILQHSQGSSAVVGALCGEFQDRFKLTSADLPECQPYASNTNCPALQ